MFSIATLGNVDTCRTECEISDDGITVAVVYEGNDGWHVDVVKEPTPQQLAEFNAAVEGAKQSLSRYANRLGRNPPDGITAGALSLWLMQKDDGTALGIDLAKRISTLGSALPNVAPDLKERIRLIVRSGHQLEAIRELRTATKCSLEEAKAWLNDNC